MSTKKEKILSILCSVGLIVAIGSTVSLLTLAGGNAGELADVESSTEYETAEDITAEDKSVLDEPTSEEPASEEPASEEPSSEEPSSEEPTSEEPTSEEPTSEEPTSEEPTTEEPSTEEPTTKVELVAKSDAVVVDNENNYAIISAAKSNIADIIAMFENEKVEIYSADGIELDDDVYVGTGCVIKVLDGKDVVAGYTVVITGDIDGNGKITANDAREVLRTSAKLVTLNPVQFVAGNMDNNDKLTASDARKVLRKAAGLD